MSEENTTPKLDAATLPLGTVMVLGKWEWRLVTASTGNWEFRFVKALQYGENATIDIDRAELQELIDRGVEFRLPKGGSDENE